MYNKYIVSRKILKYSIKKKSSAKTVCDILWNISNIPPLMSITRIPEKVILTAGGEVRR